MEKSEYVRLLAEIGGGGEVVGEEYHNTQLNAENRVTAAIDNQFGVLLLFGDGLNQFYVDTLRTLSSRLSPSSSPLTMVSLQWHIVSSTRYRAAFDLWKRGYYFEAATLSRTLWETALTLAGLKKNIVTVEEMFGGKIEERKPLEPKEIIRNIRKADTTVQEKLIWKNSELTTHARSAIDTFQQIMNQATHEGNLALISNITRQLKGETVPIFTRYDATQVGMSWNVLLLGMWALMTTLAYLEDLHTGQDCSSWHIRYDKLLRVFKEVNATSPMEIAQGFGEVINKVFVA